MGPRPLEGNCTIQVDLPTDHHSAADGGRLFLVCRNGTWHCLPRRNPDFPALGSCHARLEDLLPSRR